MKKISLSFYFGGALGWENVPSDSFGGAYGELSADAADWLNEASPEDEGLGWLFLPEADTAEIKNAAEWLSGYDYVIQAGIGGSALGNLMVHQALLPEFHDAESARPRFFLADNPDPMKIGAIWEEASKGSVALVGVSKSGATAETMAQFLWFRQEMKKLGREADSDILVITDPKKGIFRSFARESGCRVLDLPPSVGGRYSVLSSAGLTSACALGIDIDSLLEGAREMKERLLERSSLASNPARLASSLHLFHENKGRPMSVIMPYSSRMSYFAEWFAQLWGESLGKNGMGTTPVRALGAIDQHSQVQLYTDGPDDKFFTLINIKDHGAKIFVPKADLDSLEPLSYLEGAEAGEMLGMEAMSTAAAIMKAGRPLVLIELEKLDEVSLGALIFYFEYMTAMTGRMMGIDPFDQPGVEQGKKYTYGLMGREGFEPDAKEAEEWFKRASSRSLVI